MKYLRKIFAASYTYVKVYGNKTSVSCCSLRSLSSLNYNMETAAQSPKTEAVKRPLLKDETNEKWVKRIQLNPVIEDKQEEGDFIRRKLRKFVLLLSYCGKDYLGMQRNPGAKTVEEELLLAMLKASLIKEDGFTYPQIYRFQRAARTDKGVSAARQIVSVKLPDDIDIAKEINKHLPKEIQVMKAVRVTQKFDAKLQCDARSYSYLTPTFAFAPIDKKTDENYRISPDTLEHLRSILNIYKGTHNFHNFTAKVKFTDRSARRYIIDFKCCEPYIRNGLEWVLIKVKGQSFMLHQIRKMIGLAMAITRGFASDSIFDDVWKNKRCDIPIAPGLGLVLEEPHYDFYNKKYDDGFHEMLLWNSVENEVQAFREEFIDSEIIQTEINEKVTLKWLETLSLHNFCYHSDNLTETTEVNNGIGRAAATLKRFRDEAEVGQREDLIDKESAGCVSNQKPDVSDMPNGNDTKVASPDIKDSANS